MSNKKPLVTINQDAVNALANIVVTPELIESGALTATYEDLEKIVELANELEKGLKAKIKEAITPLYEKDGTTTLTDGKHKFTLVAATTALSVDSAKLKKEYPDVYKACVKTVNKSASLRVTTTAEGKDE